MFLGWGTYNINFAKEGRDNPRWYRCVFWDGARLVSKKRDAICVLPSSVLYQAKQEWCSRVVPNTRTLEQCNVYKGSAPRAADAARYARARKTTTKCEGGRKKRPMIWCI